MTAIAGTALPHGWTPTTLEELVVALRPKVKPKDHSALRFVGMDCVEAATMRVRGSTPASAVKSAAVHFLPGDLLYGRLRPYLNKLFRADFEGLASAEFIGLVPSAHIESRFFQYLLNSREFVAFASHLNTGDRPRVDYSQIALYSVALPPLPEQRRIVAEIEKHLTRLDAAIAALTRAQANLKRYRASVLKAACEGRLVPTEAVRARVENRPYESADALLSRILDERQHRWEAEQRAKMAASGITPSDDRWKSAYVPPPPPETAGLAPLPEGWVWTTIETIGDVLLGRQRAPQYATGRFPHPYLRVANVFEDRIDFSDLKFMDFDPKDSEKYRLRPGDILLSEGQSPELVGRSAIYAGGVDGLCFQKTLHRFRRFDSAPSPTFVQAVFRAYLRNGIFRRAASLTVNIAHLTLERIKPLPFPLPPAAEQERIVAAVDRHLSLIGSCETLAASSLRRAQRLRQAVLRRAFEGRLVPQNPSDEPASALLARIKAEPAAASCNGDASSSPQARRRAQVTPRRLRTRTAAKPETGG